MAELPYTPQCGPPPSCKRRCPFRGLQRFCRAFPALFLRFPALFLRYSSAIMTLFISLWTMFITYDMASAACS